MRQQQASVLQSIMPVRNGYARHYSDAQDHARGSRNRQARIPDRLDHTSEYLQSRPIAIRSKGFTFDSMTQALGLKIVYLD
jgi:hypothetical protein